MKANALIVLFYLFLLVPALSQNVLGRGEQPQVTVDDDSTFRMVFGSGDKIYYSISLDRGISFSAPAEIAQVKEMHLGMGRGPQIATSKKYTIVTAIDKKGDIHWFRLAHRTGKWIKSDGTLNDTPRSAPEGLMSLAADNRDNFFAVWLDTRLDGKNNVSFSSFNPGSGRKKNRFVYKSPESHVCECCKPSIAVRDRLVAITFRNWLMGSRDIYLTHSEDRGKTFSPASKLGHGTWQLNGCPMDGGGVSIGADNSIHTAWQRQGQVFYAQRGIAEQALGQGRSVGLTGDVITWQRGKYLIVKRPNGLEQVLGVGGGLKLAKSGDLLLAAWEQEKQIVYQLIRN